MINIHTTKHTDKIKWELHIFLSVKKGESRKLKHLVIPMIRYQTLLKDSTAHPLLANNIWGKLLGSMNMIPILPHASPNATPCCPPNFRRTDKSVKSSNHASNATTTFPSVWLESRQFLFLFFQNNQFLGESGLNY